MLTRPTPRRPAATLGDPPSALTRKLIADGLKPRTVEPNGPALRVESPRIASEFQSLLTGCERPAPWSADGAACVIDANGRHVLTVDVNSELTDGQADELAAWICMAVNTCAGFRAVPLAQAAE